MLRFGLQGLTGPIASVSDTEIAAYCRVFLDIVGHKGTLLIARDMRPEGERICAVLAATAAECGVLPVDCGALPAPALALAAKTQRTSGILVTARSAAPDQTGLRFFSAVGEISRYDEARISAVLADAKQTAPRPVEAVPRDTQALTNFIVRYTAFQTGSPLRGWKIGVCQHSSTARTALIKALSLLGAQVEFDAATETYLPFDPIDPDPLGLTRVRRWQQQAGLHAVVSASLSGDYPFLLDNKGEQVPGDILAPLCAAELGAKTLFIEGTASAAAETLGGFERITRVDGDTAAVMASVEKAIARGAKRVMGYDRKGGVILGFDTMRNATTLGRLICTDGILPLVSALVHVARADGPDITAHMKGLGLPRSTSMVLSDYPWTRTARFLRTIPETGPVPGLEALGQVVRRQEVSGLRVGFDSNLTLHFEAPPNSTDLIIHVEGVTTDAIDDATRLLQRQLSSAPRSHDQSA